MSPGPVHSFRSNSFRSTPPVDDGYNPLFDCGKSPPVNYVDPVAVENLLDDPDCHNYSQRNGDRSGYKLTIRYVGQAAFPDQQAMPEEARLPSLHKFTLAVAPSRRAILQLNFHDSDLRSKRLVFDNYDPDNFIKARVYFNQRSRLVAIVEKDIKIEKNAEMDSVFQTSRPVQELDENDCDIYMSGTADVGFERRVPPEDLIWP